jgi:hypothetical protein
LWRFLAALVCLKASLFLILGSEPTIVWTSDVMRDCEWKVSLMMSNEPFVTMSLATDGPDRKVALVEFVPLSLVFPLSLKKHKNQSMIQVPTTLLCSLFFQPARSIAAPILSSCLVIA